jgi:Protein of unknwon function (DUF3310)
MDSLQKDSAVHKPHHYTAGGIEVFDFIKAWGLDFPTGNIIKYVVRSPYKGRRLEDLRKARWYLDQLISQATLEHKKAEVAEDATLYFPASFYAGNSK